MGRVENVKEKLHFLVYDSFGWEKQFGVKISGQGNIIRFFVDTQGKTKLETNLQQSGVLPSTNIFEARALRVVSSDKVEAEGLEELIYNSVTSLFVGEKVMFEAPTFWFPSGAGVSSAPNNHGDPDPMATFKFAEPVVIAPNQNFRVEMLFPHGQNADSPLDADVGKARIWVVLDGYLTRDVQ